MSSDHNHREQALLSLLASEVPCTSECPSEEALAEYIDGVLDPKAHKEIKAHLDQCPDCYGLWMEVADVTQSFENEKITSQEMDINTRPDTSPSLLQFIQEKLSGFYFPITMTALSVVFAIVLLFPASQRSQNPLDNFSTSLSQQLQERPQSNKLLPLPWENESLSFQQTSPTPAQRALGAGLWLSQNELHVTMQDQIVNPFPPTEVCCWEKTQWQEYYDLGRWLGLMWWQTTLQSAHQSTTVKQSKPGFWQNQYQYFSALKLKIEKSSQHQNAIAVSALEAVAKALQPPVNQAQLRRDILKTIHVLGPTTL